MRWCFRVKLSSFRCMLRHGRIPAGTEKNHLPDTTTVQQYHKRTVARGFAARRLAFLHKHHRLFEMPLPTDQYISRTNSRHLSGGVAAVVVGEVHITKAPLPKNFVRESHMFLRDFDLVHLALTPCATSVRQRRRLNLCDRTLQATVRAGNTNILRGHGGDLQPFLDQLD